MIQSTLIVLRHNNIMIRLTSSINRDSFVTEARLQDTNVLPTYFIHSNSSQTKEHLILKQNEGLCFLLAKGILFLAMAPE